MRDDGAVVYINGTEVVSSNLPPGSISYDTYAYENDDEPEYNTHQYIIGTETLVSGTNVIAVEIHQWAPDSSDISFDLQLTPVVALVSSKSEWSYLDDGSDQGTLWRDPGFDASSWLLGEAQLGYGDGDEATVVGYGSDEYDKYITTYFLQSFDIWNPGQFDSLSLDLKRDDGAVVYINGIEVVRSNMPSGTVAFDTPADYNYDWPEDIFHRYTIDTGSLVAGTNVIAVEVHQESGISSDMSFDLHLIPEVILIDSGSQWSYLDDGSDQGSAWRDPGFDDSTWSAGGAELGYGDGDENTIIDYGPDPNDKYTTTYFRHTFSVTDPTQYDGLQLELKRDDGAIVYINGTEIIRSVMPTGIIAYDTLATEFSDHTEDVFLNFSIDASVLISGTNMIAVEIHQWDSYSSDISFDLKLKAIVPIETIDSSQNTKPVANAGVDQTIVIGGIALLDGTASSDADSDPLTYQWTVTSKPAGSTVTLNSPTSSTPSITPDEIGFYLIELIVNDGTIDSDPATVLLQVDPVGDIQISLSSPSVGLVTNQTNISFVGSLSHTGLLTINGGSVTIETNLSFIHLASLSEGVNLFNLAAIDAVGTQDALSRQVTLDTSIPPVPTSGFIIVGLPDTGGNVTITGQNGSVEPFSEVVIVTIGREQLP